MALALSGCGSDAAPSTSADNTAAPNIVADNTAAANIVADNTAADVTAADNTVAVDIDATFEVFGAPNTVVTDSTKGDVIEFTIGAEPSVAGFQSAESVDVSEFADAGALTFDFKLVADADSAAQTSDVLWKVKVESNGGQENGGQFVELVMPSAAPELQAWINVTLPLSVLESHEIDLQAIDKVMVFPAWGEGAGAVYQLANVALVEQAAEPQGEIVEFYEGSAPEGAVPIATIKGKKVSPLAGKKVPTSKASYPQYTEWQRITQDDMNKMITSSNQQWYKERFAETLGSLPVLPVNVSVNDVKLGSGTNPNATYNWWADRRLVIGSPLISPLGNTITQTVPYTTSQRIDNWTSEPQLVAGLNMYSNTMTKKSNWNVTVTAGASVTASVGLPFGLAGGEVTVSLDIAAGGGGSTAVSTTSNYYSPFVTIPVGCYAIFSLQESWNDQTDEYYIPMQLQGIIGADYGPGKWNGHHFYAVWATSFFPEYYYGQQYYTAKNERKANHVVGVLVQISQR